MATTLHTPSSKLFYIGLLFVAMAIVLTSVEGYYLDREIQRVEGVIARMGGAEGVPAADSANPNVFLSSAYYHHARVRADVARRMTLRDPLMWLLASGLLGVAVGIRFSTHRGKPPRVPAGGADPE